MARRSRGGRELAPALLCALAVAFAAFAPPARAAAPDDDVERLVARARDLHLADERGWQRLVHYRPGWFGAPHSQADGVGFFLAPEGASDPAAELEATVRAFFSPAWRDARFEHPACRFPARFAWLDERLAFAHDRLAPVRCDKLTEYRERMRPEGVAVVFSSYYLNNPASAFGHTFLRIGKHQPGAIGKRRELLDSAVDFSAHVDTPNAMLYAFKGLLGLFPGTFSRLPYYYKVREYNDYESRDLWEYELALDDAQVERLVDHLWELGSTHFDYFYLDENCSYHVLGALEAAIPERDLVGRLRTPVIPIDTVRVLADQPGLVRSVRYRPSLRRQFEERTASMPSEELAAVEALVGDPESALAVGLDDDAAVRVLDAAADLVDMRWARDLVDEQRDSPAARKKQRLLERRASLLRPSADLASRPVDDERPDRGHRSQRLGLGSGASTLGAAFFTLSYRTALHDLADPPRGQPELSQIEFAPIDARVWPAERKVRLEEASLVRIVSLNEISRFDHRLSWRVDVGGTRMRSPLCPAAGCFVAVGEVGAGPAFTFARRALTLFFTADTSVYGSSVFQDAAHVPLRAAVGPWGGVRWRPSTRLVALATGSWQWAPYQEPRAVWSAHATTRWSLSDDLALGVDARVFHDSLDVSLSAFWYR